MPRARPTAGNVILVAVNLDPLHPHYCTVVVPPEVVGVAAGETYGVTDLLTSVHRGPGRDRNYVRLDPAVEPAHILRVDQTRMKNGNNNGLPDDPLWYKDAIFYELRVRSFYDSNGDGVGDFPGLTRKLDYLQRSRRHHASGCSRSIRRRCATTVTTFPTTPTCIPIAARCTISRLSCARRIERGLRVVTELVLNHTSDQHPWFQRARRAPAGQSRIAIFTSGATRPSATRTRASSFRTSSLPTGPGIRWPRRTTWHRFYSHQPDLNFDNPAVSARHVRGSSISGSGWESMACASTRCLTCSSARAPTCENLPETHAFLRDLRRHVDANFSNRMLLAEANQWPEDAVTYLEDGKECHMAFHFPIMPRMFMAVRMEDRFPLTDIWAQTPPIDEACQWAIFLRNHDELTLEMVTDEERDYMYRAYAQESRMRVNLGIRRRLAPLLGNNRRAIELMNGLLLSLPGTPVIYYGDEIGMGDNIYLGDRDGVRTPMQWSGDRNAGFSTADPQRLILPVIIDHEYHYQTVNVESAGTQSALAAVVDAPADRAAQTVQGLRARHD